MADCIYSDVVVCFTVPTACRYFFLGGGGYWMTAAIGVVTSIKIFVFQTVIADKIYSFLIVIVNF